MIIRRFARPYARALMDVAGSAEKANTIRGELMRFEKALSESAELREVYANPGIAAETKKAITDRLVAKMKLSDLAAKAVDVMVRFNRINEISDILSALHASINEQMGVAVAEVRSAKNLNAEEMQQLAAALEKRVGKKVELDVRTDPSLLGGFVAKVGSEIYDASVVGKINRFRDSLT